MKHVEERFGKDANKEVLLMCIGVTSGVGRLIFGRVADYVQGVNKVYLQVKSTNLEVLHRSLLGLKRYPIPHIGHYFWPDDTPLSIKSTMCEI